uniref:Uncharacterized protein n=1 Tax=Rhizophora mucronata TaxID=61149 RepID=A0A2P2NV41_RHIMU
MKENKKSLIYTIRETKKEKKRKSSKN